MPGCVPVTTRAVVTGAVMTVVVVARAVPMDVAMDMAMHVNGCPDVMARAVVMPAVVAVGVLGAAIAMIVTRSAMAAVVRERGNGEARGDQRQREECRT